MTTETKEAIAEKVKKVIDMSSMGTENYWKHYFGMTYTDGVKGVAEAAGAYWLIDIVASYQTQKKVRACSFQVWGLEVKDDNSAVVTMKEDSGQPIIIKQEIPYTDFPLPKFEMWMESGVLILPCEH